MAKWFYLVGGQEIGPVESRQLKLLADSGRLGPNDPVRREDMTEWYHAGHVNGLFTVAQPSSPTASSTSPSAPPQSQPQPSPALRNKQKAQRNPWRQSAIALGIVGGYFLLCVLVEFLFGRRASGVVPTLAEIAIVAWVLYWLTRRLWPEVPSQRLPQAGGRTEPHAGTKSDGRLKSNWLKITCLGFVLLAVISWVCFRVYLYQLDKRLQNDLLEILRSASKSTEDRAKSLPSELKTFKPPTANDSPSTIADETKASTNPTGAVPWVARSLAALSATTNPTPPISGERYENSAKGFSIVFPYGWEVRAPLANSEIAIKANHKGDNHNFATLLVKTAKLELPDGAPDPTSKEFSATYFSDGRPILDSAADLVDGRDAYWLETKTSVITIPAYMVSYFFVHGGAVYCLEGVIVTQDPKWIDDNAPSILQSIRSFRFTK